MTDEGLTPAGPKATYVVEKYVLLLDNVNDDGRFTVGRLCGAEVEVIYSLFDCCGMVENHLRLFFVHCLQCMIIASQFLGLYVYRQQFAKS